MTAPRGPQRSEDRSDLTPAAATHDTPYGASEARAEVQAFLGDGWTVVAETWPSDVKLDARHGFVRVSSGSQDDFRAAVSALKAAWRDAVRPWERAAVKEYRRELLHNLTEGLEEDSNG